MRLTGGFLTALILSCCNSGPTVKQQHAQCALEAERTFPITNGHELTDRWRYTILCMRSHRYELTREGRCSVAEHGNIAEERPECFKPDGG